MWAAASPTMTRIARVQAIGPPTALATEIARTIPTHMAIIRTAMLSIAQVLFSEPWPWPASCRCAVCTIPCRRMITESSAPVPAPRTDRPSRADHPGQADEPARCLWKERVNAYGPGHAGIDCGNVEGASKPVPRYQFWFVRAAPPSNGGSGILRSAREDSPTCRFRRQAALAESPGRSASSGGSRDVPHSSGRTGRPGGGDSQ